MLRCTGCNAELPHDAQFCIECGSAVARAATGPTQRIGQTTAANDACPCGVVNPGGALFCVRCGRRLVGAVGALPPAPQQLAAATPPAPPASVIARRQRRRARRWRAPQGRVLLIGFGLLCFTGRLWPGILVLSGIAALLSSISQGRTRTGIQALILLGGLALLLVTGTLWPGVLVLFGFSMLMRARPRPAKRVW